MFLHNSICKLPYVIKRTAFNDVINDDTEIYKLVTGHTALQLRKKNFFLQKVYAPLYYAKFGTFLFCATRYIGLNNEFNGKIIERSLHGLRWNSSI